MLRAKTLIFIFSLAATKFVMAQDADAIQQYIATYKELAIEEMIRTGVPDPLSTGTR